jgi:hypothetical protein
MTQPTPPATTGGTTTAPARDAREPTLTGVPATDARPPEPPAVRERLARRWSRARWVVAVSVVVLLSALVIALGTSRGTGEDLDPDGTGQGGTRALAQILRREGVEVTKVTRSTAAARLADDPRATLVVVNPSLLGPEQLNRLSRARPGRLVLVAPDAVALNALAPQVRTAGALPTEERSPSCDDADALAAGPVHGGGHVYRLASGAGGTVCYPAEDVSGAGSYLAVTAGGRDVRIVGQERVLVNRWLADHGNAALAIRALGAHSRVVWYFPDPLEVSDAAERPSLLGLLPSWVFWVTAQLALAVLVAIAWRARRLGRLVTEPLPVVVRAAETEEGRARLYRQSHARGRAGATLRTAALRRLATRLAVPTGTTPEQVAALVAAATGRPDREVHDTLLGPAPTGDAALVALADELDTLERQVATSPHADGPGRTQQP